MSQKTSPAAIGAFVLGAIVLIVAALLVFGSGRFLKNTDSYILYFEGNAQGLHIGAPVSFRGIRIGTVNDITLISDVSTDNVFVEVLIEIEPDTIREFQSQPGTDLAAGKDVLQHLIEDLGVRAKLGIVSLITGQLQIALDYYPDTPAHLYGFDPHHPELPTLPSTVEELRERLLRTLERLESLPVQQLIDQLVQLVKSTNEIVDSRYVNDAAQGLGETLATIRDLAATLNEQVTPLAGSLTQTSQQARGTFADVSKLLQNNQGQVVHLAESLERVAAHATDVLGQTNKVVSDIEGWDLQALIRELSEAARAIRGLANYLERHPEALLRGKR